jgi:hypothetical protein
MGTVRSYLSERFPIVSQGGTLLSGYACCYLLYGQAHGNQVFGWATVVGGVTAVLLALVRRIVDDVEDLPRDIVSGRFSFADGGRRRLRGLVRGAIAVTALVAALNLTCSLSLLAVSVGIAAWFPLATAIKHTVARLSGAPRAPRVPLFIVNETCPAVGLLYPYAVWHEVAGESLPTMAVVAIVGLFWTTYQFWNFTRKVGAEDWTPWFMTLDETRSSLLVLLALAAAFSLLLAHYANLPFGYSLYGLAISAIFAAIVLRWWSRLPTRDPDRVGASWGGFPFPIAVEVGVLVAVLVS